MKHSLPQTPPGNPSKRPHQTLRLAVTACLVALGSAVASAKTLALLVGVSSFQAPTITKLEGPPNDVAAMHSVLIERLGAKEADIRQLTDQQATKKAVLAELVALAQRSQPGDRVVVYFSTHGTSAYDSSMRDALALPYSTGALALYDTELSNVSTFLVGKTDLQPVFKALDEGKRRVWVISDSCFSGQLVRSMNAVGEDRLPSKHIPLIQDQEAKEALAASMLQGRQTPLPYPYRQVSFFSASSEGEMALDVQEKFMRKYPTLSGKPQGAFTDALIRVLRGDVDADYDRNGQIDEAEVLAATSQFMAQRGYGHQAQRLPSLQEDSQGMHREVVTRSVNKSAPAAPVLPPTSLGTLQLATAEDVPPGVRERLSRLPGLKLVALGDAATDLRLRKSKTSDVSLELRTASGDLIASLVAEPWSAQVQGQFEQQIWAKQITQLGAAGRRGLLGAEITPSHFGGNFVIGDKLAFAIQPDKAARVLLLNVDSAGKVTTLYPQTEAERQPLPALATTLIPGDPKTRGIDVKEPLGMDMQLLFAFDQDHPELAQLQGLIEVGVQDARLRTLPNLLRKAAGGYTMATTELRTLPKPAP